MAMQPVSIKVRILNAEIAAAEEMATGDGEPAESTRIAGLAASAQCQIQLLKSAASCVLGGAVGRCQLSRAHISA